MRYSYTSRTRTVGLPSVATLVQHVEEAPESDVSDGSTAARPHKSLSRFRNCVSSVSQEGEEEARAIYPILLTKFIYLGGDKPDAADRVNHIQ